MHDLNELFSRIQEAKARQKDIRSMYKDALSVSPGYTELVDELKRLRDKKKLIETAIKEQFSKEMIELEDLKIDIESNNEMMSDLAVSKLVKGETVEVNDKFDNQYEPVFKVLFKKVR